MENENFVRLTLHTVNSTQKTYNLHILQKGFPINIKIGLYLMLFEGTV